MKTNTEAIVERRAKAAETEKRRGYIHPIEKPTWADVDTLLEALRESEQERENLLLVVQNEQDECRRIAGLHAAAQAEVERLTTQRMEITEDYGELAHRFAAIQKERNELRTARTKAFNEGIEDAAKLADANNGYIGRDAIRSLKAARDASIPVTAVREASE